MAIGSRTNKTKKLLMLTDGNSDQASARIRALQYIPLLEKVGYNVCFIPRVARNSSFTLLKYIWNPIIKRVLQLRRYFALYFQKWDLVVIQRLIIDEFTLKWLKGRTTLIFDFDDAIYLNNKKPSVFLKAGRMVSYADQIVISTPWLNQFCNHFGKDGVVIPTPVETDQIIPGSRNIENKIPVIGWIGSSWTTPYLKILEPVLQRLGEQIEFQFLTVGAKPDYTIAGVNHENLKWENGIEPIALSKMDIGVMPLTDDDYARAKGGYKLYLYMAAGIPSVASPIGVNKSIIKDGETGFLAVTENDWINAFKKLLSDKQLVLKMGSRSREQAKTLYDRKVCFSQLIRVIESTNKVENGKSTYMQNL